MRDNTIETLTSGQQRQPGIPRSDDAHVSAVQTAGSPAPNPHSDLPFSADALPPAGPPPAGWVIIQETINAIQALENWINKMRAKPVPRNPAQDMALIQAQSLLATLNDPTVTSPA